MATEDYKHQPYTQSQALLEAMLCFQNGHGSQPVAFGTEGLSLSLVIREGQIRGINYYQNGQPYEPQLPDGSYASSPRRTSTQG